MLDVCHLGTADKIFFFHLNKADCRLLYRYNRGTVVSRITLHFSTDSCTSRHHGTAGNKPQHNGATSCKPYYFCIADNILRHLGRTSTSSDAVTSVRPPISSAILVGPPAVAVGSARWVTVGSDTAPFVSVSPTPVVVAQMRPPSPLRTARRAQSAPVPVTGRPRWLAAAILVLWPALRSGRHRPTACVCLAQSGLPAAGTNGAAHSSDRWRSGAVWWQWEAGVPVSQN